MKRAAIAAVILGCLALTGCASGPDHGVIHDKSMHYGYMSYCGKGCYIYIPAAWEFDLYASKNDHGWVHVSETTYDKYKVGDYYGGTR